ncbi:hypothetical protein NIES2104_20270 [Leptolyngbya sp. NIES-2104]|nr:hypothetical protein NIES2104_20270 [Leptolyngbya sp. NIES-2104]
MIVRFIIQTFTLPPSVQVDPNPAGIAFPEIGSSAPKFSALNRSIFAAPNRFHFTELTAHGYCQHQI